MKKLLLILLIAITAQSAAALPMPISCPYPQVAVWTGVRWSCIYPR